MKTLLLFLLASFCVPPHKAVVERWKIEKESNLYIEGRTNVSAFTCGITEYLRPDTLCFYKDDVRQSVVPIKGGLTINVNRIDCRQQYMNKDLFKTLKGKECPELKVSLQTIGHFSGPAKNVKGVVVISLAGVTRTMEIDYTVEVIDAYHLRIHGCRQVAFADFGLIPPRKMGGLVKVEEHLNVRFKLVLRAIASGRE